MRNRINEISLDTSKLDLAFILDTTSSMHSYIDHAKKNINLIAERIIKSEKCHLRIALVNYRDHPPQDTSYITELNQFTDDINKVKEYISNTRAFGGGDLPEAVCCGLHDGLENLEWRKEAVKCAVLIADAPPHGLVNSGDSFPDGCPLKHDPVEIAHGMAAKGISLYCIGCEPQLNMYKNFFMILTHISGGQYVALNQAQNLTNVLVDTTHDEVFIEKEMAKIRLELLNKNGKIDQEELNKRVEQIYNSKNLNLNQNGDFLNQIKDICKTKNLTEMKKYADENSISLVEISNASLNLGYTMTSFFSTKPKKIKKMSRVKVPKHLRPRTSARRTRSTRPIVNGIRKSARLIELAKLKDKN